MKTCFNFVNTDCVAVPLCCRSLPWWWTRGQLPVRCFACLAIVTAFSDGQQRSTELLEWWKLHSRVRLHIQTSVNNYYGSAARVSFPLCKVTLMWLAPIKILIIKRSPSNCLCVKLKISKSRPGVNLLETVKLLYKSPGFFAIALSSLCKAIMVHGWL